MAEGNTVTMATLILGSPPGLWLTCGASVSISTSALSSTWPRSTWVQALRPACRRTPRMRSIYKNRTKINKVLKPFRPAMWKKKQKSTVKIQLNKKNK